MNPICDSLKDRPPNQTIADISQILADKLQLVPNSTCDEIIPGCFSARATIAGTPYGTNGKGIDSEYALASAYGEFIERLQNQELIPVGAETIGTGDDGAGFIHAPDETPTDVKRFARQTPEMYGRMTKMGIPLEQLRDFIVIPYHGMRSGKCLQIPQAPLSYLYGTNGMCAGNTHQEALVQGISEIVERYVMFRVLNDAGQLSDYRPGNVPLAEASLRILAQIENRDGLSIMLKDASSVIGFPVICSILLDKPSRSYHVRWGAHPVKEIALERSLTELFQRKTMDTLWRHMTPFSFRIEETEKRHNKYLAFHTGVAHYPPGLFGTTPTAAPPAPFKTDGFENRRLLNEMFRFFDQKGWELLIRDVSFLGFPGFHVIIPGMSEIRDGWPEGGGSDNSASYRIRGHIMGEDILNEAVLRGTLDRFMEEKPSLTRGMVGAFGLPLIGLPDLENLPVGFVVALLYLEAGQSEGAIQVMIRLVKQAEKARYSGNIAFYACFRDVLCAVQSHGKLHDTADLLNRFYDSTTIHYCMEIALHPQDFFSEALPFHCGRCGQCRFEENCLRYKTKPLLTKIRLQYRESCPSQEDLIERLAEKDG